MKCHPNAFKMPPNEFLGVFLYFFRSCLVHLFFAAIQFDEKKNHFSAKFCLSPHQCFLIGKNLCGWTAKFFPGPHQCIQIGKILSGWMAKFFCLLKPTISSDFSPLMSALAKKGKFEIFESLESNLPHFSNSQTYNNWKNTKISKKISPFLRTP